MRGTGQILSYHFGCWLPTGSIRMRCLVTVKPRTVACHRKNSTGRLSPEHHALWLVRGRTRTVACHRNTTHCGLSPEVFTRWLVHRSLRAVFCPRKYSKSSLLRYYLHWGLSPEVLVLWACNRKYPLIAFSLLNIFCAVACLRCINVVVLELLQKMFSCIIGTKTPKSDRWQFIRCQLNCCAGY